MTTPRDAIAGLRKWNDDWPHWKFTEHQHNALRLVLDHSEGAATAIDALQARVKELEVKCADLVKAGVAMVDKVIAHGDHSLRAEQERDKANKWQRWAEDQRAKFEQERDEAYERAAKIIDAECDLILSKQTPTNDPLSMEDAVNQHLRMIACILPDLAAAIRRLAGPDKEGK